MRVFHLVNCQCQMLTHISYNNKQGQQQHENSICHNESENESNSRINKPKYRMLAVLNNFLIATESY